MKLETNFRRFNFLVYDKCAIKSTCFLSEKLFRLINVVTCTKCVV